jgi:hypothetical protein
MVLVKRSRVNQTLGWGGLLLILAGTALIPTVRSGSPVMTSLDEPYSISNFYGPRVVSGVAILAACVVLAAGVRGGSIVGKRIWGRIVLIGFGVCAAYMEASGVFGQLGWAFWAQLGVLPALLIPLFAIAAVLAVAWERALPGRWSLLPAITLGLCIALAVLYQVPVTALVDIDAATIYGVLSWVLLGTVALVLARRTSTLASRPRGTRRPAG